MTSWVYVKPCIRHYPDTLIDVHPIPGGLMLTGRVNSALDAEEARRITSLFVGDDEYIVNRLQVAGPNQVNLRVKVAEVSRNVLEAHWVQF